VAKVLCVLYDDPVEGYPKSYARDGIPKIDRYPGGQTTPTPKAIDFTPGTLLGSVTGELGLRKYLESNGHTLVVTSDKDGPGSRFERELPDAEVVISQPFWPAYLTAERVAKAKKLRLAITAGIVLHRGGKVRASYALYAAALLGKYSFAPAGLWFWLSGGPSPGQRARRLLALVAIVLGVAVAVYLPFWRGPGTVIVPLQALGRMNPGGSITEVLGILLQLLLHGSVTPPDMAVQTAVEVDRAAKQASWLVVSWIARVVFLAVVARVLPRMLRKTADERTLALGTGVLTVALLTLASHRFQCWYLLAPLPFFGLECPPVWRRWWTAAVAVAVPVDFACVLERSLIGKNCPPARAVERCIIRFRRLFQRMAFKKLARGMRELR